jgi:hypothetical protein
VTLQASTRLFFAALGAFLLGGCAPIGRTNSPEADGNAAVVELSDIWDADVPDAGAILKQQLVPRAKRCYELSLEEDPVLEGRLDISLSIRSNGEVATASSLGMGPVGACVAKAALGLKFAPLRGEAPVGIDVPIEFRRTRIERRAMDSHAGY